jgi:hypothetical protein
MLTTLANKSFLFALADQPASGLVSMLRNTHATHLIAATVTGDECYYLIEISEARVSLAQAREGASAAEALALVSRLPTPALSPYDSEDDLPERAVIVEDGLALGFIDSTQDNYDLPISLSGLDFSTRHRDYSLAGEAAGQVQRSVVTDFPPTVRLGETCSLLVNLSADFSEGDTVISASLLSSIDVIVQAKKRFELVGEREASLFVTDEDESPPVRFQFRALEEGTGVIRIHLHQGTQSLGSITLNTLITTDEAAARNDRLVSLSHSLPAALRQGPDLALFITEQQQGRSTRLVFELRTRGDLPDVKVKQQFEPVELEDEDLQAQFRSFFRDIDELKPDKVEEHLKANGSDLFLHLFPRDLRNLLWDLRDRVQSIQVQSEEPWIPWELCRMLGRVDGRFVPGPFLCEAFQMTRWLPKVTPKTGDLKLRKIALVVPNDSGLKNKDQEREFLLSCARDGREVEVIPATLEGVRRAFDAGVYDGVHFTCHGRLNPTRPYHSTLQLERGESLAVNQLASAEFLNVGRAQPLVFLNACQAGQNLQTLSGAGGWAERFLEAGWDEEYPENGAAAFIGAYWSINDASAHQFAVAFYTHLFAGLTLGEAVHKARLAIRSPNNPTWLAYTVFANPLARVM